LDKAKRVCRQARKESMDGGQQARRNTENFSAVPLLVASTMADEARLALIEIPGRLAAKLNQVASFGSLPLNHAFRKDPVRISPGAIVTAFTPRACKF
jgi:hypothetical protein